MRIVIDLQGAQSDSRFRGIGRYAVSLAKAMAQTAGEHDIWLALNASMPESVPTLRAAFAGLVPERHIRLFDVPAGACLSPWSARAAELLRECFLATLKPDVVLVSSLFEGYMSNVVTSIGAVPARYQTAVILYDLIPWLNQKAYLPTAQIKSDYVRKLGWLRNADILLAISESSRQDAITHLGIAPDKIVNISAAIDEQLVATVSDVARNAEVLHRLGIKPGFILYTPGGFDARKNFARLFEAYSQLDAELTQKHQLVITSRLHAEQRAELLRLAANYGVSPERLVLTDYVCDLDLISLYSLARLFVFPSTHEGFGLPVLEAMACGSVVIGSDCSSVPEVIGCPEALFDPWSVRSIAVKMNQGLRDEAFRARLLGQATEQCRKFSWHASARHAMAALELRQHRLEVPPSGSAQADLLHRLIGVADHAPSERELFRFAKSIAFSFADPARRQLLLDVSCIVHGDGRAGIRRTVRSLLHALLTEPPPGLTVRPVYFADGRYVYANAFTTQIFPAFPETGDTTIDFAQDDIYLSLDVNRSGQLEPLHRQLRLMGVQINYVVYNQLLHRSDCWPAQTADLFADTLHTISRVADNLICISATMADAVREWLRQHPEHCDGNRPTVSRFQLGADIAAGLPSHGLPADAQRVIDGLAHRRSFLMVGTVEPRKGHAQALAAFETLWAGGVDVNLLIIGKRGWLVDALVSRLASHPEKGHRLFWLEGASDDCLEQAYSTATCLIAASEAEGFGLPLLEASRHRLPMIVRDLPVFREIAGEHAFYFQGMDAAALTSAVEVWLQLYGAGRHPNTTRMPWLTWKQSAEQLKAVLMAQA
jgi:glycosyltransferase involved in cell wall biosynthesis